MLTSILRYRKVEDATTAKDEPTQVYLLEELVKAAQASPEDAQHIVEHLLRKLDSKNPVVKAKALKACKYLVHKGAKDAHRILQRTAAPIRQLQHYKGLSDPLKGDALNERVRTSAKEAVSAIFSADTPPTQMMPSQSRIQGFGNQSMGTLPSSTSRYTGFGSEQFSAGLEGSTGRSTMSHDRPPSIGQSTGFLSGEQGSLNLDRPRTENERRSDAGTKQESVLGNEAQLVDAICQPGGVRSTPAKEDLRRFIDTAGSLNGPKIAVMLEEKLKGSNWQETYRALCAIEAVILQGSSISCGEIGVHFQGDLDIIRRCLKSTQKSVRDRAQRILNIFVEVVAGADEEPEQSIEEAPPLIDDVAAEDPHINPPSVLDLLDDNPTEDKNPESTGVMFGGLELRVEDVQKTEVVSNVDAVGVSDMFSGLSLSNTSTPAKGSNVHLAALLAPSPATDPFPEAVTPLKAETNPSMEQQQGQQQRYPVQGQGMMPSYGMMGGTFVQQMPLTQPQGGMPYAMPPMQSAPAGYMMPAYGYGQPPPASVFQRPPGMVGLSPLPGNREEVPLSAFMGPAHVERRNSSSNQNSAFSFVGDHISQLREKK